MDETFNNKSTPLKGYLYLLFAVVSWGTLFVAGKIVLETVPVLLLLATRYVIGLTALFTIAKRTGKSQFSSIAKEDLKYIWGIGIIAYFFAISFQLLGNYLSDASLSSLINSMNPVIILVLAYFILKEPLTRKKMTALIISLSGAVIIIGSVSAADLLGVVVNFASVTCWCLGTLIMRKACSKYDALLVTVYSMGIGLILAIPAAIIQLLIVDFSFSLLTPHIILWLLYIGLVCTAAGFYAWNKGLSIIDAGTSSLFLPIQPMVSTILGIFILKESITINFLIGSILIVSGVLYSVKKSSVKKTSP